MKEYTHSLRESLAKGLTPLTTTPRNVPCLLVSEGLYPEDGTSVTLETVSRLDTSSLGLTYPYPQILELVHETLICGPTALWAYRGGEFVQVLSGLTEGVLWSVADFQGYAVLTNGCHIVVRDPESLAYATLDGLHIPPCGSICTIAGQVIVGAPNTSALEFAQFARDRIYMQHLHRIVHEYLPVTYPW